MATRYFSACTGLLENKTIYLASKSVIQRKKMLLGIDWSNNLNALLLFLQFKFPYISILKDNLAFYMKFLNSMRKSYSDALWGISLTPNHVKMLVILLQLNLIVMMTYSDISHNWLIFQFPIYFTNDLAKEH